MFDDDQDGDPRPPDPGEGNAKSPPQEGTRSIRQWREEKLKLRVEKLKELAKVSEDTPEIPLGSPPDLPITMEDGDPRESWVQQKRISRIKDGETWARATNKLIQDYRLVAKQPHQVGRYSDTDDIIHDIRSGKVFVFPANPLGWVCAWPIFIISGIVLVMYFPLSLIIAGLGIAGGIEMLSTAARSSRMVVGPRGMVWGKSGFLWEDVEVMDVEEVPVDIRSRYGRVIKTIKKCRLHFLLWDGSTHHIAINHDTNEHLEWPEIHPHQFIGLVVEGMYQVYGKKSLGR